MVGTQEKGLRILLPVRTRWPLQVCLFVSQECQVGPTASAVFCPGIQQFTTGAGKRVIASGDLGRTVAINDECPTGIDNKADTTKPQKNPFRPYRVGSRRRTSRKKDKPNVRVNQMDGIGGHGHRGRLPEDLAGEPNECPVMVNGVSTLGLLD